jgi:two-component system sensor histidine kinase CreC
MQEALEGKKYVEQYVQKLTHETQEPPVRAFAAARSCSRSRCPRERRARFVAGTSASEGEPDPGRSWTACWSCRPWRSRKPCRDGTEPVVSMQVPGPHRGGEQAAPCSAKREPTNPRRLPCPKPGSACSGDAFLLHQAVSNLLQNAIDFSGPEGRIALSAAAEGGAVLLRVEDAGTGIPAYARPRVFDKFYSLERPGTGKKSTGLGLNFVREVALLHGGDVRLENLPGGGVRATLVLPEKAKLRGA